MIELEMQEVAAVAGGVEVVQAETGFWEGLLGDLAGWMRSVGGSPTSIPVVGSSGIRG